MACVARSDPPLHVVPRRQVLPLVESGALEHFGITQEELSVMCASHWGEPFHLAAVRSILAKIGCVEDDLECGGHSPEEQCAYDYVRAGARTPFVDHIYNNCSGKHAGFLALCKFLGHPTKGYINSDHPVQVWSTGGTHPPHPLTPR